MVLPALMDPLSDFREERRQSVPHTEKLVAAVSDVRAAYSTFAVAQVFFAVFLSACAALDTDLSMAAIYS